MSSPTRAELIPAAKRFNRWQFIEAQNLFRELSEHSEDSDQTFLMGLSSIAGGFAKIWHKGGEPHAMVSLITEGIRTLESYQPKYLEIELDDFITDLSKCLGEAKRWRRGDTEIFDRDLIPRIQFGKV